MDEQDKPISADDLRNLVGELRMMARRLLFTESCSHSFTPTALAMTALRRSKLKEQDWEDVRWENRSHFFGALSLAMRNALIDHARKRSSSGRQNLIYCAPDESFFRDLPGEADEHPDRFVLLEEALATLETADKRLAETVHQFYFMGYSTVEIARFREVNEKTVDRDLNKSRTMLRKIIEDLYRKS